MILWRFFVDTETSLRPQTRNNETTSNSSSMGTGRPSSPVLSVCAFPCQRNEYIVSGEVSCCWTCQRCRSNEVVSANRTGCDLCPEFSWPDANGTSCRPIEPTYLGVSHPISAVLFATSGERIAQCEHLLPYTYSMTAHRCNFKVETLNVSAFTAESGHESTAVSAPPELTCYMG